MMSAFREQCRSGFRELCDISPLRNRPHSLPPPFALRTTLRIISAIPHCALVSVGQMSLMLLRYHIDVGMIVVQ